MKNIEEKIRSKTAIIGVIGLGHTGLALANEFGTVGFKIIGYDIIEKKIQMLLNKESYLPFLPLPFLFSLLEDKRFIPTSDPAYLKEADVIIISVPTPLNEKRAPDLTFITKAGQALAPLLQKGQLVVLQSTSFPGTTEEVLLPVLEEGSKLRAGSDFLLAYVPEREDPGNPSCVLSKIPRIMAGTTPHATQVTHDLYKHITDKIHICSSPRVAEAAKAFENTYRLINIAFVDEMKMVFDRMNINCWEVIEAASTKPFGFTAFYPGPGIGGECIPVDPVYLSWKAETFHISTTMINNAILINEQISAYIIEKIISLLSQKGKKSQGANVFIIGVAFKPDLSDCRESPALKIMPVLKEKGVHLSYNDPFVPTLEHLGLVSEELTEDAFKKADCVVIITNHTQYNWQWICEHSSCLLDTRNACKDVSKEYKKNVVL